MVEESGKAVGGRRDGVLQESHMGNEAGEVNVAMKTAVDGHRGSILIPALGGRGASLLGQLSPYREFQNSQGFVERFCLNTTAKTLT